jgi:hypothetical protein
MPPILCIGNTGQASFVSSRTAITSSKLSCKYCADVLLRKLTGTYTLYSRSTEELGDLGIHDHVHEVGTIGVKGPLQDVAEVLRLFDRFAFAP